MLEKYESNKSIKYIYWTSTSFVNSDTNLSLSINRITIPNRIETLRLIIADNDNVAVIIEEYTVINIGIIETINIFDIPLII